MNFIALLIPSTFLGCFFSFYIDGKFMDVFQVFKVSFPMERAIPVKIQVKVKIQILVQTEAKIQVQVKV